MNDVKDNVGLKTFGLRKQVRHQLLAVDAFRSPGPVVDRARRHELPALFHPGDEHGREVGSGSVDGGGIARGAGAQND